jgi:UDP:flavonoid glycosyltransferase YjiC (YdhE family)
MLANGLPSLPARKLQYKSPYLEIIVFPKELDYSDLAPLPDRVYRMDTMIRESQEEFELPEKLKKKQGKLIYFSLGTLASLDSELLKKFLKFIEDSPHRFIVSMGMSGDTFELPDNCWGDKMVPQTKVLSMVDMAIIHGGNNSLAETFYYGKPMIVLPIFADQYDNAQRVEEKGYGRRIDPYHCTKKELLDAIEEVLIDEELKMKMEKASLRMRNDLEKCDVCQVIQSLVKSYKAQEN